MFCIYKMNVNLSSFTPFGTDIYKNLCINSDDRQELIFNNRHIAQSSQYTLAIQQDSTTKLGNGTFLINEPYESLEPNSNVIIEKYVFLDSKKQHLLILKELYCTYNKSYENIYSNSDCDEPKLKDLAVKLLLLR